MISQTLTDVLHNPDNLIRYIKEKYPLPALSFLYIFSKIVPGDTAFLFLKNIQVKLFQGLSVILELKCYYTSALNQVIHANTSLTLKASLKLQKQKPVSCLKILTHFGVVKYHFDFDIPPHFHIPKMHLTWRAQLHTILTNRT